MSETTQKIGGYEPSVRTVEMVCDRLAELGLAIGPDTARALVREVIAAEGPRVDARLRDSLDTALQTIKIAAQSAMGLLAATSSEARQKEAVPAPPEQLHVSRRPPAQQSPPTQPRRAAASPPPAANETRKAEPRPPEPRRAEPRPAEPRRPRPDVEEEERRPIFRRPGRR